VGDDERTVICMWLAAGMLVTGFAAPLGRLQSMPLRILGVVGTLLGIVILGVGVVMLVLRRLRR